MFSAPFVALDVNVEAKGSTMRFKKSRTQADDPLRR
jgi:hypothetical protein